MAAAIIIFICGVVLWLVLSRAMPILVKWIPFKEKSPDAQVQCPRFSCMVQKEQETTDNEKTEAFVIKIRGKITAPRDMYDTDIQVLIADITDGEGAEAKPVLCTDENRQMDDSPAFCLKIHNGTIPQKVSILPNWVKVASIPCNILKFPGKGRRKLVFVTSLLSHENGNEFLSTSIVMHYENESGGYVDKLENIDKPIALSVQIACQAAATGGINTESITIIKDWISLKYQNVKTQSDNLSNPDEMSKYLDASIDRIKNGNHSELAQLCRDMFAFSTIVDRYNLLKLCLSIINTNSYIQKEQTDLIRQITNLLHLDEGKISAMAQKILIINTNNIDDIEFLLGITEEMTIEQKRQRVKIEYQKWNGRVTHPDSEIRSQADLMLSLIAEERSKLVAQKASL